MRVTITLLILISTWTSSYTQDNSTINFDGLTIDIKSLGPLNSADLVQTFKDKAKFIADIGSTLDSATIIVATDYYKDIQVFQSVETSLSISNEGPHCDLTEWKHYQSEWKQLEQTKPNTFQAIKYDESIARQFPQVSIKDVIEAVRKECGDEWAPLIKDIKTVYEGPCDVSISRYFLKLKAKDKKTGQRIEKIIEINIPMGC
ncbi:MAG TPA: hypothetical protein VFU05_05150 [Cyclobacteriaceae bacterium]|nr:hypothetical protein [Cyclobacteriaceae bacterium]